MAGKRRPLFSKVKVLKRPLITGAASGASQSPLAVVDVPTTVPQAVASATLPPGQQDLPSPVGSSIPSTQSEPVSPSSSKRKAAGRLKRLTKKKRTSESSSSRLPLIPVAPSSSRLRFLKPPYSLGACGLEVTTDSKWNSPKTALKAMQPMMLPSDTAPLEQMTVEEQCGQLMLQSLKVMETAFVLARRADHVGESSVVLEKERSRAEDERESLQRRLREEELKSAGLAAKLRLEQERLRAQEGKVEELSITNRTLKEDLDEAAAAKSRLEERLEAAEREVAVLKVEVANIPAVLEGEIEKFVKSDTMVQRTGVEVATCLSGFVKTYADQLPSLPACLEDYKEGALLPQEWFDMIPPDSP